ncbi:neprilysin-1-like [Drosophila takahashii]|uniref:neprilysin-1-like n=1 Tax=Drosophila takahashii TaxID=29030 RepID=UPI001CF8AC59|nr:neprilysin-1-like [Drosophila takahashii]
MVFIAFTPRLPLKSATLWAGLVLGSLRLVVYQGSVLGGQQEEQQHLKLRKYPAGGRPSKTDDGRWTIDCRAHSFEQLPSPLVWKKVQSKCTTQSLPGAASGEQVNSQGAWQVGRTKDLPQLRSDGNPITNSKTEYLDSYANLMKSYMNFSVDPCEDFYEYSCGNYRQSSPLFWVIWDNSKGDITKNLVGKTEAYLGRMDLAESLNVLKELKVAQRLYNACLGASLSPFPADDPHYLALIRSIGAFPAVDGPNWNASNFSWFNMSAQMINYGAKGLIDDAMDKEYPFEPYMISPKLGFHSIVEEDIILGNSAQAYKLDKDRMRGYLRSYKLPEDKIAEVIDGVFAFWREAITVEGTDRPGNCEKFENSYFQIVWNGEQPKETPMCESYFLDMDKVYARHSEAVANYLAMKLLFAFDAQLNATQTQGDYCERTLRYTMPFLFNKLFIADHLSEKIKLEVIEIMEEFGKSVQRTLEKEGRFDSKDPKKGLTNLALIESSLELIDFKLLADRIIPEIGRLEIVDDSYAATNINLQRLRVDISRFGTRHAHELSNSSRSQNSLLDEMSSVSLFFQPPVYDPSWPFSLKFGGLASWLSRFLPQFEDVSYDYDIERCFAPSEDFGDSGLSFSAYQSRIDHLLENPKQEKISEQMPGLDLLPNQLFFLKSTQLLCSGNKEDAKYKAEGFLASNEDFFRAFNCPVGSGMRRVPKPCRMW